MHEKQYRTEVRTDSDYDEIPGAVEFVIDEATAREIVRLAVLIKANGLYKIEKFDYRAAWIDSPDSEHPENIRVDAGALNVSETEFWFSTYIKHTDVQILSERQRIGDLMDFFGLNAEAGTSAGDKLARLEAAKQNLVSERDEVIEQLNQANVQIVISLEGGIIQEVTSNAPLQYVVYDYDIEGCDGDDVATRPALGKGVVEVYAGGIHEPEIDAEKIAEIFATVAAEGSL